MLLTLKIVLVPSIIALISFAGRVWGPRVSGLLGGLPGGGRAELLSLLP